MMLHFEEKDLRRRQECTALASNLEWTALNNVIAKKQYQRDTAKNIFETLMNRFVSGVHGHQAIMRFRNRKLRDEENIDNFLDDIEMLRRRSQPDKSNSRLNRAVGSNSNDNVNSD